MKNASTPSSSARRREARLAEWPFRHGEPGAMKRLCVPDLERNTAKEREMNSGPLSERRKQGAPCSLNSRARTACRCKDLRLVPTSSASSSLVNSS